MRFECSSEADDEAPTAHYSDGQLVLRNRYYFLFHVSAIVLTVILLALIISLVNVVSGMDLGESIQQALLYPGLALGIFAPACILVAILVDIVVPSAISRPGAMIGAAAGSAAGVAADEFVNQVGDAGADNLSVGGTVIFIGDHVTDADHGWYEIHDLKGVDCISRDRLGCDAVARRTGGLAMGRVARVWIDETA